VRGRAEAGVAVRPPESLLIDRAYDFLAAGPADAAALVSCICQLPGAPLLVAEHMAQALLGPHPDFARGTDGRWWRADDLARTTAAATVPADAACIAGAPASGPDADALGRLSYVVVDVETTGGRAEGGDRVTEIAAVLVEGGEVREVYETLVNPQRPIPRWITSLTNISWEMVKDAPSFREVCDEVTARLRGRVFVAHNAAFDWRFVTAEVARATGEQLDGPRLCTVRLARRLLPQLPRRSLDNVARHYGVEIEARHRAAGDALATAHVLLALLRDAADRGCTTWAELEALLAPSAAPRRGRRRASGLPGFSNGAEGA